MFDSIDDLSDSNTERREVKLALYAIETMVGDLQLEVAEIKRGLGLAA